MKIAGIVAEYNPFHKGHRYQIEELAARGFDGTVAVMSGNFVQRADVALTDKYRRAAGAVACGVDLVLELPLPYAVASAEDFARGGIGLLAATGIVDTVCCGCESGDRANRAQYEALRRAEKEGLVRDRMKQGLSYPAACREAVLSLGGVWNEKPNDVLALSYRKALEAIAPQIPLLAIERKGDFHGDGSDGFESAESIRRRLRAGEDVTKSLPRGSYEQIRQAPAADLHRLERAILARYRTASPEELKQYYGMREGLAERICEASGASTLEELYSIVKTKRFPHSAVRRAVLCGYLGIPSELPPLSYLRVLAFNERGQTILKAMKKTASLPVVSILTPQMQRNPDTAVMTGLQLRGDEFFALCTDIPGKRLRDLTESARKIGENGL